MPKIEEVQLERMLKFPRDRIAFLSSSNAVEEDCHNFKAFWRGDMTLAKLCKETARVNHLPRVTELQMINELQITGWWRDWGDM